MGVKTRLVTLFIGPWVPHGPPRRIFNGIFVVPWDAAISRRLARPLTLFVRRFAQNKEKAAADKLRFVTQKCKSNTLFVTYVDRKIECH